MAGAISSPVPPTRLNRRERGRFVAVVRFGEDNVSRNTRMTPDFKMRPGPRSSPASVAGRSTASSPTPPSYWLFLVAARLLQRPVGVGRRGIERRVDRDFAGQG